MWSWENRKAKMSLRKRLTIHITEYSGKMHRHSKVGQLINESELEDKDGRIRQEMDYSN